MNFKIFKYFHSSLSVDRHESAKTGEKTSTNASLCASTFLFSSFGASESARASSIVLSVIGYEPDTKYILPTVNITQSKNLTNDQEILGKTKRELDCSI